MAKASFATSAVGAPVITNAATPILSTHKSCLHFLKKICNISFILKALAMICTAYIGYKIGEKIYEWFSNQNQTQEEDSLIYHAEKIWDMEKTIPPKEATPLDLFIEEDLRTHDTSFEDKKTSNDIRVLLIGKTGDGVSSTGNSILGEHLFQANNSSTSTTTKAQVKRKNLEDRDITVVDSPSIIMSARLNIDTNRFINNDIESMRQLMTDLLLGAFNSPNCQEGFDAIVFVLRLGRFDAEHAKAIKKYKEILGSGVFQKHVILAFTAKDDYEWQENERTFEQWCDQQSDDLQALMEECDYRCVFFDNKSKNMTIQKHQRKELMDKIDKLRLENGKYVKADYQKSVKSFLPSQESQLIENISITITALMGEKQMSRKPGNTEIDPDIIEAVHQLKKQVQLIELDIHRKRMFLSQLDSILA